MEQKLAMGLVTGISGFPYLLGFTTLAFMILWLVQRGSRAHKPGEPPILPYRFPIVGHTLEFIHNSEALINRGRLHFQGIATTFRIILAGRTIYVLTDPDDLATVHRHSEIFTARSPILEFILVSLGVSRKGAEHFMHSPGEFLKGDLKTKSTFQTVHDIQARHLTGGSFSALVQDVVAILQARLASDAVASAVACEGGTPCVSLKRWARETQVLVLQEAFFGPTIGGMDKALHTNLLEYSRLIWQAWYHVPKLFRKANPYGIHIEETFKKYLKLRPEERKAAWSIEQLIEQLQLSGLSDADASVFLLFSYWGICMNVSNMTFWLLAHIIADPNLTATIREETRPAFKKDNVLDTQYLLTNCPRLDSVWHECLRLYTSVTTSRFVTHDTQLGSVFLKKGHPILFSARQIAFHDKRFGADDPLLFDDMRFFNDPTLKNVNSHRPFGGGKYVCLGRHLTRHVHAAFVAILLKNFEVGPAFPQVFPRVHENEPAVGVLTGVEEFFGS